MQRRGRPARHDATADGDSTAESLPIVPDIGAEVGDASTRPGSVPVEPTPAPRRRLALIAGVVAVAVLAVGGVGALINGLGGSDPSPGELSDLDEVTQEPIDALDAADGASAEEPVAAADPDAGTDRIASFFAEQVDEAGGPNYLVAYHSVAGITLLSADGVEMPDVEVAVGFREAAGFPILSTDEGSWAIDPTATDIAWLVSTQFRVLNVGLDGSVGFINSDRDPVNIGVSSFGAWGPGVDLPPGAELLARPGRGILILPETGGTFELRPSGLEPLSDDRAVGASLEAEVYQRCDEMLLCELYVTSTDHGERVLDVPVGTRVHPSPGGRWVLAEVRTPTGQVVDGNNTDEPGLLMIDASTGAEWQINIADVRSVAWSPDGNRAMVLTAADLVVLDPERSTEASVVVPALATIQELLVLTR